MTSNVEALAYAAAAGAFAGGTVGWVDNNYIDEEYDVLDEFSAIIGTIGGMAVAGNATEPYRLQGKAGETLGSAGLTAFFSAYGAYHLVKQYGRGKKTEKNGGSSDLLEDDESDKDIEEILE